MLIVLSTYFILFFEYFIFLIWVFTRLNSFNGNLIKYEMLLIDKVF